MGHYKGKADAFVLLLGIVDPFLAHQRLLSRPDTGWSLYPKAVKSWIGSVHLERPPHPNFKMGIGVEEVRPSFRDIR